MAGYLGTKAVLLSTTAATVTGDMTVGGDATISGAATFSGPFTSKGIDDNAAATAMTLDASGNVGIGTVTQSEKLEVAGNIILDATDANIKIKAGVAGTAGAVNFTFNTDSTSFGSLSLPYDTRATVGLLAQTISAYPVSISSGTTNSSTNAVILSTSGIERIRIDNSGNVGIGESNPTNPLQIKDTQAYIKIEDSDGVVGGAMNAGVRLFAGASEHGQLGFIGTGSGIMVLRNLEGDLYLDADSTNSKAGSIIRFAVDNAEAMRIDSSGNLLVGTATIDVANHVGTTAGVRIAGPNNIQVASTTVCAYFNKLGTDGSIVEFRKSGTPVGSIGTVGGQVFLATNGQAGLRYKATSVTPCNAGGADQDNVIDLGQVSIRFDDIYATNGTIQTSDRNEKQDIDVLNAAETAVAQTCKGLLRKFRWKDAVAEKGDDARIHFGIIAQDLQDAFAAQGLDAGRYAMFISSTWWEADRIIPAVEAVAAQDAVYEDVIIPAVLDEEGNEIEAERVEQQLVSEAVEAVEAVTEQTVTDTFETLEEAPEGATERTRLGVRYSELLAFIIGAM